MYVKIFDTIIHHWLWCDPNRLKWWICLLLMAHQKDEKVLYNKTLLNVNRGQIITSLRDLSKRFNTTKDICRRYLELLEGDGMIDTESDTKLTRITICNYESYQGMCDTDATPMRHERDTNATRFDTDNHTDFKEVIEVNATQSATQNENADIYNIYNNNINNNYIEKKEKEKKEKKTKTEIAQDLERRKKLFYEELIPFLSEYPKEMLRDFYDYWTEPNKSGTKFRRENEKTWDTKRRLSTWFRNQDKYGVSTQKYKSKSEQREQHIQERNARRLTELLEACEEADRYSLQRDSETQRALSDSS